MTAAIGMTMALGASRAGADGWQPASGHTQIRLWPGAAPGAPAAGGAAELPESTKIGGTVAGKPYVSVADVTQPTLTVYSPRGNPLCQRD